MESKWVSIADRPAAPRPRVRGGGEGGGGPMISSNGSEEALECAEGELRRSRLLLRTGDTVRFRRVRDRERRREGSRPRWREDEGDSERRNFWCRFS